MKVVLIACDLLFIQRPHVDRIRARIGEALGIAGDNVLINTSHTHLGPMLPGWSRESAEQTALQTDYLRKLEAWLVEAAVMAARALKPARFGSGKGSALIGVNRRERLPDGRVILGENSDGAVDRDVDVLRFDDLNGKPLATIFCAAAHTIVLGPKTSLTSPDYVGPARELIETTTGAPSLFFQGAAGNVSPCCGIGSGGAEQLDDLRRVGAMLGGEVLKVWAQIRTHNRRGPRTLMPSVAHALLWSYEPLPIAGPARFRTASHCETLPMAPLPDRAAATAELDRRREALAVAQLQGNDRALGSLGRLHVAERLVHWAERVVAAIDVGQPLTQELKCWSLVLDDIGIVAVNGEPFAELALEVKRRSPLRHTFFLGYSNGCLGYLPTPEAFDEGGMEVHESVQNYLLPTAFTRQWGPAVVETSLKLLNSLEASAL